MLVKVEYDKVVGKFKIMHAVNNGPVKQPGSEQVRSNFDDFKSAGIPYVRNHDASFTEEYGGEHVVDVVAIFPDFDKDPFSPNSYDFTLTDEYIKSIIEANSKVFYRLGNKIEHWSKKYGVKVPTDYKKWAIVCEHVIKHYNEGWADGFYYGIEYWEIWNEADGIAIDGTRPNWTGNNQDYFDFYNVAAGYLKDRFPNLKIGGPALTSAGSVEFMEGFLNALNASKKRVPLDFFSYHMYGKDPHVVVKDALFVRETLDRFGFAKTEMILDEWNYLDNWTDGFISTIQTIIGTKGAAYQMAVMTEGQNSPLDMLMYYSAQPSCFNGLFDYYTFKPLKGYYAVLLYSELYKTINQVKAFCADNDIYVLSAINSEKSHTVITFYDAYGQRIPETVTLDRPVGYEKVSVRSVDSLTDLENIPFTTDDGKITFNIKPNSIVSVLCEK